MDLALGVLVGALFVGGLLPTRFIYESVKDKPKSPFDDIPALLGRLSCIGLGSTILAEAITGKVGKSAFWPHGASRMLASAPTFLMVSVRCLTPGCIPHSHGRVCWGCSTSKQALRP